ncbi:MAG: hypothetical protein ACPGXK_10470 [Phycisphaerae bacterium]
MKIQSIAWVAGLAICLSATLSVQAADVELVPVRASGVQDVDWEFGPGANEITFLTAGEQQVEIQVLVSGFGQTPVGVYEFNLDCSTYDASSMGSVTAIDTDCTIGEGTFGVDFCLGVDESEPTWVLTNANGVISACQSMTACPGGDPGQYGCGAVAFDGDSGPGLLPSYYAATFAFNVPADVRGTVSIGVDQNSNLSYLRSPAAELIPITGFTNAQISVPTGACCGAEGFPLLCADNLTPAECEGFGGTLVPGVTCTGNTDCDPGLDRVCPQCLADKECDDGNACTVDTCDGQDCCSNVDNTPAGECCDPVSGTLTVIDDGNQCTTDVCNPDGSVDHIPTDGASCDDGESCTSNDTCNVDVCEGQLVAQAPLASGIGSKAISITAQPGGSSQQVSLQVTSPDWPCLLKYVNASGKLQDTPFTQSIQAWDTIIVTGEDIVPESTYEIQAGCDGFLTAAGTAQTGIYADIDNSGGVNLGDVQLIVFGFQVNFKFNTLEEMDIWPCDPNGIVNFEDIQRGVLIFQGFSYTDLGCPVPCP